VIDLAVFGAVNLSLAEPELGAAPHTIGEDVTVATLVAVDRVIAATYGPAHAA
jgi:hypothetical protein